MPERAIPVRVRRWVPWQASNDSTRSDYAHREKANVGAYGNDGHRGSANGSVLLALFAGEALVYGTIRAMHAGVKRADDAAAKLQGQPAARAKLLSGQRPRLQRI